MGAQGETGPPGRAGSPASVDNIETVVAQFLAGAVVLSQFQCPVGSTPVGSRVATVTGLDWRVGNAIDDAFRKASGLGGTVERSITSDVPLEYMVCRQPATTWITCDAVHRDHAALTALRPSSRKTGANHGLTTG
jgi:hypothetical protein